MQPDFTTTVADLQRNLRLSGRNGIPCDIRRSAPRRGCEGLPKEGSASKAGFMAYEYNPQSARFDIPNPHRIENTFIAVCATVCFVAAIVLLVDARAIFLERDFVRFAKSLIAATSLLAFAVTYAFLAMAYALTGDDAQAHAAAAEVRRLDPNFKLITDYKPVSPVPAAYREFYENKLIPAWRKAGLPE